jgi:hypothetical protein
MSKLFPEYDVIDFTGKFVAQMRIKPSEVRVCMFIVEHPEHQINYVDNQTNLPETIPLMTVSMLFSFIDIDNDRGALGVYNGFDHSTMTRPVNGRNNVAKNFADVARKITKREYYTLFYCGARNEG